jgi:hypothetical protein
MQLGVSYPIDNYMFKVTKKYNTSGKYIIKVYTDTLGEVSMTSITVEDIPFKIRCDNSFYYLKQTVNCYGFILDPDNTASSSINVDFGDGLTSNGLTNVDSIYWGYPQTGYSTLFTANVYNPTYVALVNNEIFIPDGVITNYYFAIHSEVNYDIFVNNNIYFIEFEMVLF